jgi:hypothetical protein
VLSRPSYPLQAVERLLAQQPLLLHRPPMAPTPWQQQHLGHHLLRLLPPVLPAAAQPPALPSTPPAACASPQLQGPPHLSLRTRQAALASWMPAGPQQPCRQAHSRPPLMAGVTGSGREILTLTVTWIWSVTCVSCGGGGCCARATCCAHGASCRGCRHETAWTSDGP